MITQFEKLSPREKELLLNAPVLVSIMAASFNNHINKRSAADAVKLAHLRTFTAVPVLQPYYKEVDKHFQENFELAIDRFVHDDVVNMAAVRLEMENVKEVIEKLDADFAGTLRLSLAKYAKHVKRAEHAVLESFLIPFEIHGLTD